MGRALRDEMCVCVCVCERERERERENDETDVELCGKRKSDVAGYGEL